MRRRARQNPSLSARLPSLRRRPPRERDHGAHRIASPSVRLALAPPSPTAPPRRGAAQLHAAPPAPPCGGVHGLSALLAGVHAHPRALPLCAAFRRIPRWHTRLPKGAARAGGGEARAAAGPCAPAPAPAPAQGERDRALRPHQRRG